MVANRTAQKLPAAPVFRRELIGVPESGRGRKGSADLEAAVRANAEAAEEARRVALAQRRALEEVAAQRLATEKELAGLRREMLAERSEHERLVAQARFRATQEERRRHEGDPGGSDETSHPIAATVSNPALRKLETQIAERDQVGETHRQRLLEALRERDSARLELQRVSDARSHAERRLERVTEVLHRATSASGPRPAGSDGVEEQHVRALRDELAVAIARAKSAEARTNDLRDEIEAVKNQRSSTVESLDATRADLDTTREELSALLARVIEFEADDRVGDSAADRLEVAEARSLDIEREAIEARGRAVAAEQRVADLTTQLGSTGDRVEASESMMAELRAELVETQRQTLDGDAKVRELIEQNGRVEADLALAVAAANEAEARRRATEGELVTVDGARTELDAYVEELQGAVRRHEGRAAELESQLGKAAAENARRVSEVEAQLDAAVVDHGRHAIDLEATHAATAAELTSASARAEHLSDELAAREKRVGQLEAALAATTAELGEMVDRTAKLDVVLAGRDARIEDAQTRLDDAHSRIEELQSRINAEAATRGQVNFELTALRESYDEAVTGSEALDEELAVLNAALMTARAERDVAVAQADSLTLELAQRGTEVETAQAHIAELDVELEAVQADHADVLGRLDDLGRELNDVREDRRGMSEQTADWVDQCETLTDELAASRSRADDLERQRSEDRRAAERSIEDLRSKADSAAARVVIADDRLIDLRSRHADELERMAGELDAARRRVDVVDVDLTRHREREQDIHRALAMAESRVAELERLVDEATGMAPRSAPPRSAHRAPERAATPAEARPPTPTATPEPAPEAHPPSELRRAVFASLTELAGDG